jgi:hypothetical protein
LKKENKDFNKRQEKKEWNDENGKKKWLNKNQSMQEPNWKDMVMVEGEKRRRKDSRIQWYPEFNFVNNGNCWAKNWASAHSKMKFDL